MKRFLLPVVTLLTILAMLGSPFTASAAPAADGEQTWIYVNEVGFKGFELQETVDGTTDVGVDSDLAKADPMLGPIYDAVQGLGYGMRFTTSVPGKVIFGTGTLSVDGELVETRNLENYEGFPVEAGLIVYIPNGPSKNNGARWTPDSDEGWREGNSSEDCPPNDGTCITVDGSIVTWTGDVTGMADIWQGTKEALDAVRAGATMTLKLPNPMQVIQTCHIKIEQLDLDNGSVLNTFERHNCDEMNVAIKLNPGYYRFSESTSDSGGYRIRPWFGIGWMSNEIMPADYQYVVFETLAQEITDFVEEGAPESDGPATATLTDVGGNKVTFHVTADGEYKLNQEGNKASEVLTATAVNGVVSFTMKAGNKAFQLQNVPTTSNVAGWKPCEGASDWLCLDESAVEEPAADEPVVLNLKVDVFKGTVGEALKGKLEAKGGKGPYTYELVKCVGCTTPKISSKGVLSGTPTKAGDYLLKVKVIDANGVEKTFDVNLKVSDAEADDAESAAPAEPLEMPSIPAGLLTICGSLVGLLLLILLVVWLIRRRNATHVAPTITTQPTAQTVVEGQPVTFRVVASNGTDYLWTIGGDPIIGQTGATCTFTPTAADSGKMVKVNVANRHGSEDSVGALLTVTPATPPAANLDSVLPSSIGAGAADTVVTLYGRNFTSTTEVKVNGTLVPVTFVDAWQLKVTVPAADLATAGAVISITIGSDTKSIAIV